LQKREHAALESQSLKVLNFVPLLLGNCHCSPLSFLSNAETKPSLSARGT
jgi:hypothetical protein